MTQKFTEELAAVTQKAPAYGTNKTLDKMGATITKRLPWSYDDVREDGKVEIREIDENGTFGKLVGVVEHEDDAALFCEAFNHTHFGKPDDLTKKEAADLSSYEAGTLKSLAPETKQPIRNWRYHYDQSWFSKHFVLCDQSPPNDIVCQIHKEDDARFIAAAPETAAECYRLKVELAETQEIASNNFAHWKKYEKQRDELLKAAKHLLADAEGIGILSSALSGGAIEMARVIKKVGG